MLGDDDVKTIEKSFNFADKETKGYLTKRELKIVFLCNFGFRPSRFEVSDIMEKYSQHYKSSVGTEVRGISKDNVIKIISDRLSYMDKDDGIREIFQCFDMRCKGFIDIDDFKHAIRLKFKHLSEMTIVQYFRELDTNGDGRVGFSDFHFMMSSYFKGYT